MAASVMTAQDTDRERQFEDLYARGFPLVARACRAFCDSRDDAFELAQEAFVRTWANWATAVRQPDPLYYTLRTAHNLGVSRVRRLATRRRSHKRTAALRSVDVSERVSGDLDVLALLKNLPRRQRAIVVLCDLLDLDATQTGHILGLSASTVRVHLSRAHSRLREFKATGGVEDDP